MKKTTPNITPIYQIKVTLRHIKPPIRRRILVTADTKLGQLHLILQDVMGWTNSHLHAFRIGLDNYGEPNPDFNDGMKNERNVRLDKIAQEGSKLIYDYDFGDGWEHDLLIEKIVQTETDANYPLCLAGKRACPPEDCGGPPGYLNLLDILNDPKHEEYADMRAWINNEEFDPEYFSVDDANAVL